MEEILNVREAFTHASVYDEYHHEARVSFAKLRQLRREPHKTYHLCHENSHLLNVARGFTFRHFCLCFGTEGQTRL